MYKWVVVLCMASLAVGGSLPAAEESILESNKVTPKLPGVWENLTGQERAGYINSARLDACRNLCERLYGLRLIIQDKPLSSKTITSHTMVLTRGVSETGSPEYYPDGRVKVTIKLDTAVWRELLKNDGKGKLSQPLLKDPQANLTASGYSAITNSIGVDKLKASRAASLEAMKNLCKLLKVMASAGDKTAKSFLTDAKSKDNGITICVPDNIKVKYLNDYDCSATLSMPLPSKSNPNRKITASGSGKKR